MKYAMLPLMLLGLAAIPACSPSDSSEPRVSSASADESTGSDETPYCYGVTRCAVSASGCCTGHGTDNPFYCWRRWRTHRSEHCCYAHAHSCTSNDQCCSHVGAICGANHDTGCCVRGRCN
jgi:hypothetical protein